MGRRWMLLAIGGVLFGTALRSPSLAAKAKFAERTSQQATPAELKALSDAHFRATRGLEGVLNGGERLELPADKELEAWAKAWITPKFEFRPHGVKSGDPLDAPGGTQALKGSSARKALVQALAEVRKGAFGKVPRSQVAPKLTVGPTLSNAPTENEPDARRQFLEATERLVLTYSRRSTDEKGNPLPEVTALPDGNKVAINQTASFTHNFEWSWRLTETGWKIASVEAKGATAIL